MKTGLKTSLSQVKTLLILCLTSLLLGCLSILVDYILIGPIVGLLALIYSFDYDKHYFSYGTSLLLILINFAGILVGLTVSFFSIEAIVLAIIICVAISRRWAKVETSFLMTLIVSIFTLVTLILIPMVEQQNFEIETTLTYYKELISDLRNLFVDTSTMMYGDVLSAAGVMVDDSIFVEAFDLIMSTMVSYLAVLSFVAVGIAMKLYSAIYSRIAEDKTPVEQWHFMTTSVYAYFYVVLMLLHILTSTSTGVIGITVANLYNIFMFVYAYVGFNVLLANLSLRFKPMLVTLALITAVLVFPSFSLQLFAVFGVLFTIRKNRESLPKSNDV